MKYVTADNITATVLAAMADTPDPRLREISAALVTHLHAFIREIKPSDAEFEAACHFLVGLGKATSAQKNEVILASDILGASSLIALQNNGKTSHVMSNPQTDPALLGPFWRANSPEFALGQSIARGTEAEQAEQRLEVTGIVRDTNGQTLADAVVDVWQASPVGLYENQDPQQPDMNLRGRFRTDALGAFYFWSVRPAGYPVPVDGPCGDLLRAQKRHPYRPAHLHFMASKPGYKVLVTQVFADDDERLETDVTFSVVESLVGSYKKHESGKYFTLHFDLTLQSGELHFPSPPIP